MPAVVVISPATPLDRPVSAVYHPRAIVAGSRGRSVDALARLGSLGALGFSIAIPLVVLLAFSSAQITSRHDFPQALLATALYLPLYVRHVHYGLRGVRPRALPLTLLAMAAVIVGFTPLLGVYWLYAFHALAASLLVTTRPRFSFPAVVLIMIGVGVWTSHHLAPGIGSAQDVYLPAAVLDRAATVFVLVWLVRALQRIQSARLALADAAVETERQRVDRELRSTVGARLEDVVRRGNHALLMLPLGVPEAENELASLVEMSRTTLAEARRLIGRYKRVSARAELEKAAALLRAAGIEVRVDVADEALPSALDAPTRSSLQAAVADLLTREAGGPLILRLEHQDNAYTVQIRRTSTGEHRQ
jgi:signal transduction histidine kinase